MCSSVRRRDDGELCTESLTVPPPRVAAGAVGIEGVVDADPAAAATAAEVPRQLERPVCRSSAGIGPRQRAMVVDDPGAAHERAAAFQSMASHAARTAPGIAAALAAIQKPPARATTAHSGKLPALPADAAGAANGTAQAVAADESGAAPQRDSARTDSAQPAAAPLRRPIAARRAFLGRRDVRVSCAARGWRSTSGLGPVAADSSPRL